MAYKISLVNFSHGDFYNRQRFYNSLTGKYIGKFNKTYEYSFSDIDEDFIKRNKEIFNQKKGVGLWLWKPYFINKVLDILEPDEYLFYCDSSAIFLRKITPLIEELTRSGQDIMLFEVPLEEVNWTMPQALDILNADETQRKSNQILGGFILVKKNQETVNFLRLWLDACQNPLLMINKGMDTDGKVVNHRFDQSLISVLAKKNNYKFFRDPTQYGEFPEMYRTHGKLRVSNFDNSNYKTTILLLRKSRLIVEITKYFVKRFLHKYFPHIYKKIIS
jgi:hypothetical protein